MKRSLSFFFIVMLFATLAIAGCGSQTSATTGGSASPALTQVKLALDFIPNSSHSGLFDALAQGFYRAQGIDLQIIPWSPKAFPDTLVSNGEAQFGISTTDSQVPDAATGHPLVSLATIYQSNPSCVVVLADSGITTTSQLQGKIYGGYGAPFDVPMMDAIIKKGGISTPSFTHISLGSDSITALVNHRIDFAWNYQINNLTYMAQHPNVHLRMFPLPGLGINYYAPTIVASPTEIKSDPDLVRRFMKATAQGYQDAASHPEKAVGYLLSGVKSFEPVMPSATALLAEQRFSSKNYLVQGTPWGEQSDSIWQQAVAFRVQSGVLKDSNGGILSQTPTDTSNPLYYKNLFTNQFLPA